MNFLDYLARTTRNWTIFAIGFRPFYLLAALGMVVLIPLWLWSLHNGWLPASGLAPMFWHAHEMLFGVMGAVIVGFLFTAVRTWTGLQTPLGGELASFALVWLSARVAAILASAPVFFFLDIIFLPAAALRLADILWIAGNLRNLPVAGLLGGLGIVNLAFHLSVAGVLKASPLIYLHAGLSVLTVIVSLIAGRVIPFFTSNATGRQIVVPIWVDYAAISSTSAGLLSWVVGGASVLTAVLLLVAGCVHALRLWYWQPFAGRRNPILWALPLAYIWIPIALLLIAISPWLAGAATAGVHAMTVGATGGLVIAMMTRTARGHTGRPLKASKPEVFAYTAMFLAAALRVIAPALSPQLHTTTFYLAGAFLVAAFSIYVLVFAPWLFAPRVDGRAD